MPPDADAPGSGAGSPAGDAPGAVSGSEASTAAAAAPDADGEPRWLPVEIAGQRFERINLEHPEVGERVLAEIESEVDVYYDRRWNLTRHFSRYLLERPGLLEGRHVLVAGAGVGLESVVVGRLAERVTVNDLAPVALDLCVEQLERNGVSDPGVAPGPVQGASLEGVDLVVACFVVYNEATEAALAELLERTGRRGIPVLLANEDIGGHFSALLEGTDRPVRDLDPEERRRYVWVEREPSSTYEEP